MSTDYELGNRSSNKGLESKFENLQSFKIESKLDLQLLQGIFSASRDSDRKLKQRLDSQILT